MTHVDAPVPSAVDGIVAPPRARCAVGFRTALGHGRNPEPPTDPARAAPGLPTRNRR